LDDGDKIIEIVYGEEKNILFWADQSSQGRIKVSCTGITSPMNQPRKFSFVLFESLFTLVSTVSRGHSSLVSPSPAKRFEFERSIEDGPYTVIDQANSLFYISRLLPWSLLEKACGS
jgi:hypothetical protein